MLFKLARCLLECKWCSKLPSKPLHSFLTLTVCSPRDFVVLWGIFCDVKCPQSDYSPFFPFLDKVHQLSKRRGKILVGILQLLVSFCWIMDKIFCWSLWHGPVEAGRVWTVHHKTLHIVSLCPPDDLHRRSPQTGMDLHGRKNLNHKRKVTSALTRLLSLYVKVAVFEVPTETLMNTYYHRLWHNQTT